MIEDLTIFLLPGQEVSIVVNDKDVRTSDPIGIFNCMVSDIDDELSKIVERYDVETCLIYGPQIFTYPIGQELKEKFDLDIIYENSGELL